MRARNPSPNTIRFWLWLGVAGLAAIVVLGWSCPTDRSRVVVLGFVAVALFAATALYFPRKRLFLSKLGTLHAWMIGHMVLGGLLLVTVVLHGGVAELGTQGWLLYGLTFVEVGSGLWGLYELKATPRRFAQFASDDFMYPSAVRARIRMLHLGIDKSLERRKPDFVEWFEASYRSALDASTDAIPECEGFPDKNKKFAADLHGQVEEIVRLRAQQHRLDEVDRQSRRWLWIHVPASVAFLVFVSVHVAGWLYYG